MNSNLACQSVYSATKEIWIVGSLKNEKTRACCLHNMSIFFLKFKDLQSLFYGDSFASLISVNVSYLLIMAGQVESKLNFKIKLENLNTFF